MKRTASILSCLILGISVGLAQSVAEVFKGNDFLTELFVNPLGIRNLPADTNPLSVEEKIKQTGVDYKSMHLGPFGEMIQIIQPDLKIGGVPIAGVGICINNDAVMLLYQSEKTENFKAMYVTLDHALRNYAKDIEQLGSEESRFTIYMITDRYGISVGADETRQTALACLLDIKNLQGFIGLGSLIGNGPTSH